MSFKLIWSRSHSLDSFSRCTALMPKMTNSNIIEHGPKLVEAVLWCAVSLNHRPDRPWKPGLMARKNNISKIGRATQIIVHAISDYSHFLPFTHNPKHDSGGRARQVRCFVVAPLLAPSLKKVRDSGIVFAVQFWEFTASFDRSIFLSFENTSNPSAVFS
jgi:hypothetical protein